MFVPSRAVSLSLSSFDMAAWGILGAEVTYLKLLRLRNSDQKYRRSEVRILSAKKLFRQLATKW